MRRSSILLWFTTFIALYHILVAGGLVNWVGIFVPTQVHRAVTLATALTLIFIMYRAGKDQERSMPWYDYILILFTLISTGYVMFFYDNVIDYGTVGFLDTPGIIVSLLLVIPLLEAARRRAGLAIPIIILFFVCLTLFQEYLPGILYGQGYPFDRLLYSAYVGTSGIFGFPVGVASTILITFMIFGALLQSAGGGKWFMELALSLTGWSRGGPAKASVVASALFGSIAGSPSSNVATTGVVTIPLMKRVGYRPAFAGATEAVASTGGSILPPVMGAIAFVMAEWIEVPYVQIAFAALVPALLYYVIIFVSVHLQAHKEGVKAMSWDMIPSIWRVLREGWFYFIPIVLLIYFLLIQSYPPQIAGIYTLPFVIGVSFLSKDREFWLTPKKIMYSLRTAVMMWLTVVAITGSIGIMLGALEISGIGLRISRFVLDISGEHLLLTLILVGITSLIIGMGLDVMTAYVTLASLMAPALIALGVSDISAHLYVVYWGLASFITPPVCIAVYVAIGISGSKLWETGWEAVKIGIAVYLIPIAFILSPGLLLQGELSEILFAISTAIVGSISLACAVRRFSFTHMNILQRVMMGVGGVLLILPGFYFFLTGILLVLFVLLWQWVVLKNTSSKISQNM